MRRTQGNLHGSVDLERRRLALGLGAAALAPLAALASRPAAAQQSENETALRGTQRSGTITPIPIAIQQFLGDDQRFVTVLTEVITADLERSGLFRPLDPAAFIDRVRDLNATPRFQDWRVIGAQALVVGRAGRLPDGRFAADFKLFDVLSGRELIEVRRMAMPAAQWRRLAHRIADQVYERLTGEKGYFDTQIAFIDETGPKDHRRKRLALMDQDGANVRLLTQGSELVLTPRFSPNAQEITYLQYVGEQPRVVLMNLDNSQREMVGDFPGMTFAPRFSPDGQRIVMSIGEGGASGIVEMDLRNRRTRRLTQPATIDTGPCYSPDGRQIVFESDRAGTQQLHVMNGDGSAPRRISYGEGRYATPVWSPRGDLIAFTKQMSGSFLIGVMRPDGSGERILTEGFHNEGPTWSPNGRVILFFRESQGANGGPRLFSIDLTGYNERQVSTPSFGSDPAWGPLRG
ncbi:MAG TPA: Tol-Pal system beta propeller repeat protein TolB [Hyphomicrobiaceae bacterium]|nr:Tol-Pal system beta propeller repeat protein TolB [Hyphomicrobiaceae bacterium]